MAAGYATPAYVALLTRTDWSTRIFRSRVTAGRSLSRRLTKARRRIPRILFGRAHHYTKTGHHCGRHHESDGEISGNEAVDHVEVVGPRVKIRGSSPIEPYTRPSTRSLDSLSLRLPIRLATGTVLGEVNRAGGCELAVGGDEDAERLSHAWRNVEVTGSEGGITRQVVDQGGVRWCQARSCSTSRVGSPSTSSTPTCNDACNSRIACGSNRGANRRERPDNEGHQTGVAVRGDESLDLTDAGQDLLGLCCEHFAERGEPGAARAAVDKPDLQACFECVEMVRDCGEAVMQRSCGLERLPCSRMARRIRSCWRAITT